MKNMKRNNIAELMKDILKFRDTLQGRQTNYIHSSGGVDDLCWRLDGEMPAGRIEKS
jgi:hypothetical protein